MQNIVCRQESSYIRRVVKMLCMVILALSAIGLLFVYSSSSVYALERLSSAQFFFQKHFLYLVLGLLGAFVCALFSDVFFKKGAVWFYWMSLGLTALTLVPGVGVKINGASRWLSVFGISLQPSEFFAVAFLLYVASFLTKNTSTEVLLISKENIRFVVSIFVGFTVLLMQPDFGAVVSLSGTTFFLLAVTKLSFVHMVGIISLSLPVLAGLIVVAPYRLSRIMIFLDPWKDPQGKGFQIVQSLIAIGSGNVWGVGIGQSQQKFFYLPMQHTDFVFSVIAEETGLIGVSLILALFMLLCYFGFRIALLLNSRFASLATAAFITFITLRALINIMVASALLPTKGVGLPFVSFGGSAMIALFCVIGIIIGFVRSQRDLG
ncbi:putative lipid II flippase FtsW [Candidatus Babeliales bacterium]|nr:putative lipid II flippase FtsW [Candidatus Babeliales bacterium]